MFTHLVPKLILFLVVGLVLLVGLVLYFEGKFMQPTYLEPWDQKYHLRSDDVRTQILSHGILAANGHNLQNWKFQLPNNDPNVINLYVDTNRLTPHVDPFHTQAIISQGTLFEYLVIAADKLGRNLTITLFPDGEPSRSASPEELSKKRVAQIQLLLSEKNEPKLYPYIFYPDTSRLPYRRATLPTTVANDISSSNTFDNLKLVYLSPSNSEYQKIQQYVIDSANIETQVPEIMEESGRLFRTNERQKNAYRYGFSFDGSSMPAFTKHLMQSLLTVFPSMNSLSAAQSSFLSQVKNAASENAGFYLIIADSNSRESQFNTGRLYSRIQLIAQSQGFALQPLSQAIEEYPQMSQIYQSIHSDFAKDKGTILMLFRIGQPIGVTSRTMRKDISEFIVRQ